MTKQGIDRTYLFTPATRPHRIDTAIGSAADVVIVDLEDSVLPEEKEMARDNLRRLRPTKAVALRVNDESTGELGRDIDVLRDCPWIDAVVLPKVQRALDISRVRRMIDESLQILALIESARGIEGAGEIAQSGAGRLLFGSVDYSEDLNILPSERSLSYARSRLVVASAAAGLPGPVDGPFRYINDPAGLQEDAATAQALGMGGKICIHTSQIEVVESVYRCSTEDVRWALSVTTAAQEKGTGAFLLDGEMIDAPVLARAARILKARRT